MSDAKLSLKIGGKWSISWLIIFYSFPILLLLVPLGEPGITTWWGFWRWMLVSFLSLVPFLILYGIGDATVFKNRESKPLPGIYLFAFGFILGFVRGIAVGLLAPRLNMVNLEESSMLIFMLSKGLHHGILAMLALPFFTIIAASYELYQTDRKALISDLMFHQSQRTESAAVIKSLKSSMTRKVDENLLQVIKNSQEFFNQNGKSLEENWELMAIRLRKAALDTIRPFSHQLHRAGEEKVYKVHLPELLRFIASNIRIEVSWVLLGYAAFAYFSIMQDSPIALGVSNLLIRLVLIFLGLKAITALKNRGFLRNFYTYFATLTIFVLIFDFIVSQLNPFLSLNNSSNQGRYIEGFALLLLVLLVGFVSAFFHGQHAEAEFLERQLSKEQLQAMLMKREEDRLSRELAKYLHGTIQSRLMASAMAIEKAGRKGDRKALEREIAQAYEGLKVPSASYFAAPQESFRSEVAEVVSKWKDLLEVKTKIDKDIPEVEPSRAQEIANAINEGLSNAFRHGNAEKVTISISKLEGAIDVLISDDGDGPKGGSGGLGTEWFNAIAGRHWSLGAGANGRGTVLRLIIPLQNR